MIISLGTHGGSEVRAEADCSMPSASGRPIESERRCTNDWRGGAVHRGALDRTRGLCYNCGGHLADDEETADLLAGYLGRRYLLSRCFLPCTPFFRCSATGILYRLHALWVVE